MAGRIRVVRTSNRFYFEPSGRGVNGFEVILFLVDYGEEITVTVPSLDTKTVQDAANKILAERDALKNL